MDSMKEFLRSAGSVVPSERQINWFDTEFYAFIHFGVNTFTNREWGNGDEDEKIFNPVNLDCDKWVEAIKSAGMKGVILTAKHHDGFCLWQTNTTEHCVRNSPWKDGKGDVVRELSDACRKGGIKFGFYLSPWDRNASCYGTDEYNDFYKAQLTELLTGYGDIFEIWFDGACGEGPNGRRQEYDFDGYIELIRKYQPKACIFNDHGPDVRWCGNEGGKGRHEEWSVVPSELCWNNKNLQTERCLDGGLSYLYNSLDDIGSLNTILYSKGLVFCGSEIDMSIRPGWFYHENEEPHSLERLWNTYLTSVGSNANFNLNIPPRPDGSFDERDVERLMQLGDMIRSAFSNPITELAEVSRQNWEDSDTQCVYNVSFRDNRSISYIVMQENLSVGQRVARFIIQSRSWNGWNTVYEGTTIGHKRICRLKLDGVSELRVVITSARAEVNLKTLEIYG